MTLHWNGKKEEEEKEEEEEGGELLSERGREGRESCRDVLKIWAKQKSST